MDRTQYQLLKDNKPIALGSMVHCLDVFYWEIYYGYNHLEYDIVPFSQDEEVYHKAKAWEELKGLLMEEYPQLIRMWESTHGEGEHAEYCKANEILERMDKLDNTNEFSNLLSDLEDE